MSKSLPVLIRLIRLPVRDHRLTYTGANACTNACSACLCCFSLLCAPFMINSPFLGAGVSHPEGLGSLGGRERLLVLLTLLLGVVLHTEGKDNEWS